MWMAWFSFRKSTPSKVACMVPVSKKPSAAECLPSISKFDIVGILSWVQTRGSKVLGSAERSCVPVI